MTGDSPKTTKGGVVHPRIARAMEKIGSDISYARRTRGITVDDFATRLGVGRGTVHRLENGEPGVSLNTLALALHAIGRLDALASIADPANDHVTMMQMKEQVPKRISKPRPVRAAVLDNEDTEDEVYAPQDSDSKFKGF